MPEGVDRLVAVDDVAEQTGVPFEHGQGVAGVRLHERPVDLAGELLQPRHRLAGHSEAYQVVQHAGLEQEHLVPSRHLRHLADARPRRRQVTPARFQPGPCAFPCGDRRGHRAVADLVRSLQRGRRGSAFTEQQVPLGHADVGPHQRRVLPGR